MADFLSLFISNPWLYWTVVVGYGITIAAIIGIVISENRNPVKSLAWVTVLFLLPVLGVVLYFFFGRNIKNMRIISRRDRRKIKSSAQHHFVSNVNRLPLSNMALQQVRLARKLIGAQYYANNQISLYTDGVSKFDALKKDIQAAKESISIQYYIIDDDKIGNEISVLLQQKAREGVKIRVIYDHVGSWKTKKKFFKKMEEAGIEAYPFFKVSFTMLGSRINWRNHRKLCIIDNKIGYIGGFNIADRYITGGKNFNYWRDTHARVVGPAVIGMQNSFLIDWRFMGQPFPEENEKPFDPELAGTAGVQMLTSGPTSQWANIAMIFQTAIANASKRIFIQTPYFLPTEGLLKALQTAALAGVDVRIMMPKNSDSSLLKYASMSYFSETLRSGIKFYLYTKGMLHSKTMVIDDDFSTVGSTNFDFRSFEHNFEGNILIYSQEVNKQMQELFIKDMKDCEKVNPTQWKSRPILQKAKESLTRLLAPIL